MQTKFKLLLFGLALSTASILPAQTSLSRLLNEMLLPVAGAPAEDGPGFRRWEASGQAWNTLIAASAGQEKQSVSFLAAMKDSLPLAALFSTRGADRYNLLKVDKSLAGGWTITTGASEEISQIDWVEMKNEGQRIILAGQPGSAAPRFLLHPQEDGTCLVISWDNDGEEFESLLLYNPEAKAFIACAPFALNIASMDHLFLKAKGESWIEFAYRPGHPYPAAVATHEKYPGNLQIAVLDLDLDGRMDVLRSQSGSGERATFKKLESSPEGISYKQVDAFMQQLVERAVRANSLWLKAQWIWYQLRPLGVELPERVGK